MAGTHPVNEELASQIRHTTGDLALSLNGGLADCVVSVLDSAFGFVTGTILGTIAAGMIGLILAAPALAVALDVKEELTTAGFFGRRSPTETTR